MQTERARSVKEAEFARARESQRWEERLTLIVPPTEDDDEVFYPQGRLEHPFIKVAAPKRMPPRLFNSDDYRSWMLSGQASIVSLRAVQMALRLPNGKNVVWWTWEMGR